MKRLLFVTLASAVIAVGCSNDNDSPTNPSQPQPTFTADLRASNEVPPITSAESSGTGNVTVTFDVTRDSAGNITSATTTFVVNVSNFPAGTTLNIAHIHEAPAGATGSIVVNTTLTPGQTALTNGAASFTKSGIAATPEVVQRILNNPAGFYFNIHSTLNPAGVIRGQLVRVQ
jgi:hypothetical protein